MHLKSALFFTAVVIGSWASSIIVVAQEPNTTFEEDVLPRRHRTAPAPHDFAKWEKEIAAYEEFITEQVNQGGGVYGLHIPRGEQARVAFAAWRKMKGR